MTSRRWDELMADIKGGMLGDVEYFTPLVDSVNNMRVGNDWFLLANDFASYLECQEEVDRVYKCAPRARRADRARWRGRAAAWFFSPRCRARRQSHLPKRRSAACVCAPSYVCVVDGPLQHGSFCAILCPAHLRLGRRRAVHRILTATSSASLPPRRDEAEWTRRSIMYTAGSGKFNSDRTIRQYADEIWDVKSLPIPADFV